MTGRRALVLFLAVALSPVVTAAAQDVPVVFVHGIFSSAETWRATSQRLAGTLQIAPYLVDMPSTAVLETQTAVLNSALGGLPANAIAVGHSQGGLISRQWSRTKSMRGILTLGTPHTGSQLTARGLDLINFNYMVYNLAGLAIGTSSTPDFAWLVYAGLQVYLSQAQWLSWNGAATIASSVAVAGYVPVATQLVPGSGFINNLNTSGNLAREDLAVSKRVALAYTANDYWRAGIAVGLAPSLREEAWTVIRTTPPIFDFTAAWLDTTFPPTHFLARSFAMKMRQLAAVMRDMDPQWCWAVTGDRGCTIPHDGIISVTNQRYPGPGALNFGVNGPAHTQETRQSDAVISSVLTGVMGVVARGAPPPPPSGGGGGGGADTLTGGQRLYADQQIASSDGAIALRYQSDGNLVLYGPGGSVLWDAGTWGHSAGRAEMQTDGNFVIYDAGGTPVWATGSSASGAYLKVHREGYVMIHDASNVAIWWSGSGEP
jgi:pimeloyl-ACP methyl ester carboxylesterase